MIGKTNLECRARAATAASARVAGMLLAAAALSMAPMAGAQERSGAEIVQAQCSHCHAAGTAGAPKIGDKAAWVPRLNKGIDTLVHVAIRGHGGMPPRGGKADLTDTELRAALLYMFDPAGSAKVPPQAASHAAPAFAGPHRVTVGGVDVYFGLVPASRMRHFPAGSPEAKMHGGVPSGSGYHHVNVSLFDSATQAPVKVAAVELDIEQVGMGQEKKDLEAMTVSGGVSYGGYVRLIPKAQYVFIVRATRPGGAHPIEARFQEKAD